MMSRSRLCGVITIALLGSASVANALTLVPTELRSYRVLPRFSRIVETGGFADLSNRYSVSGGFSAAFGPGLGNDPFPAPPFTGEFAPIDSELSILDYPDVRPLPLPFPPIPFPSFGSRFTDADLTGRPISTRPISSEKLDVDAVLNLTELRGERIPSLNPLFDLYLYTGETDDGSSVRLLGALVEDWFFLAGGTFAPPGSGDFIEYRFRALARQVPFDLPRLVEDVNGDSEVNAADYAALRDTTGGVDALALPDLSIFDVLESTSFAVAATSALAAPEPASLLGLMGLMAGPLVTRRRD